VSPATTGKQLIRLFRLDGRREVRRANDGIAFSKVGLDARLRITIIPDQRSPLPDGTAAAVLGPGQSFLGRKGLGEHFDKALVAKLL
jgi:hypothetical protein